nr:retinol dehydrogenase 16-like [Microcebus murinus]
METCVDAHVWACVDTCSSCLNTTHSLLVPYSVCVCLPNNIWLYLAVLVGLYYLVRWYRERQVVSHLRDKYVFIMGYVSGFGNLLARQLDMRGMRVLAACRTEKAVEQLRAQMSDRLETVTLDVTKTDSITAAAQWVKERGRDRGLWSLMNNAGISFSSAPNKWLTKRDFVTILDVNLLGMIEVTLSLLPLVRKVRGHVVNVSSVAGRLSLVGGSYSISKFGVEAFSDSLSHRDARTSELLALGLSVLQEGARPFGVKVAVVQPGTFKTNMTNTERVFLQVQEVWDRAPPEIKELYGEKFLASYLKLLSEHLLAICNENLSEVTDCMEHALTTCHPRTRYSAGWDAKLFYLPMSYMPTFLVDAILT